MKAREAMAHGAPARNGTATPAAASPATLRSFADLPPFDEDGNLHVVVETTRHSRSKFKFDEELSVFRLGRVLPSGMVFPYDFGFVPSTRGEDGDPLDVLLLMDEPTFAGCLVKARLVGAFEAKQQKKGAKVRNDRLVAVAVEAPAYERVTSLDDADPQLLRQIDQFFVQFAAQRGKKVEILRRVGPAAAMKLVHEGIDVRANERCDRPGANGSANGSARAKKEKKAKSG